MAAINFNILKYCRDYNWISLFLSLPENESFEWCIFNRRRINATINYSALIPINE